jgi:hypothetical protein
MPNQNPLPPAAPSLPNRTGKKAEISEKHAKIVV